LNAKTPALNRYGAQEHFENLTDGTAQGSEPLTISLGH
jgi:hypothetical protein